MTPDYPMAAGGFDALARIAIDEAAESGLDPRRVEELRAELSRIRVEYLSDPA